MSSSSDETYEEYERMECQPEKEEQIPSSTTTALGECTVCAQPAHGLHFGVLACRACAAFYRRTVVLSKLHQCRRAHKNCAINKQERYLCRYCRFQKCISVGMQADRLAPFDVQWSRDKAVSEKLRAKAEHEIPGLKKKEKEPFPLSHGRFALAGDVLAQKDFLEALRIFKKPEIGDSQSERPDLVDISPIIQRVAAIFENPPILPDVGIRMTLMQRMMVGINFLRAGTTWQTPTIVTDIDSVTLKAAWERQLYAIAEWAMHTEEYAALPGDQKLSMYKASWGAFYRLERIHLTVKLFGDSLIEKLATHSLIFMISNDVAVDFHYTNFDFSFITDLNSEAVKGMFRPFMTRLHQEVARPMIDHQITDTELAFMLGQLVWHLEGRKVSKETLLVSEAFRARISNELHDYYVYELKMANYASRLQKLMGIVNDVENILYERNKVLELARIFDVFKIDISDPGLRPQSSR